MGTRGQSSINHVEDEFLRDLVLHAIYGNALMLFISACANLCSNDGKVSLSFSFSLSLSLSLFFSKARARKRERKRERERERKRDHCTDNQN
jgi:hypothetical protein